MNAYLSGDASPDLTAKVQYILNYNSYMDFLTSERNDLVASLHDARRERRAAATPR